MIRKFTLHILAITAVTPDIFDLPQEQNAMIICIERTDKNIWSCKPENVLICVFPAHSVQRGGSRSPAVAAALLKMSVRSDEAVWRNPYYVPNTLVYYRLCREYGLRISKMEAWLKVMMNKRAFSLAQKGRPCKYEWWEILE